MPSKITVKGPNSDVLQYCIDKRVTLKEVAEAVGYEQSSFGMMLKRKPLSQDIKERLVNVIDRLHNNLRVKDYIDFGDESGRPPLITEEMLIEAAKELKRASVPVTKMNIRRRLPQFSTSGVYRRIDWFGLKYIKDKAEKGENT